MLRNKTQSGMVLQGFFYGELFRAPSTIRVNIRNSPGSRIPMPISSQPNIQSKFTSSSQQPSVWLNARSKLFASSRSTLAPLLPAAVQRRTTSRVTTSFTPNGLTNFSSRGKPLDKSIRTKMEGFFNADFSNVRIHEGPAAKAMGALAFTLGEVLYFSPGLYAPTTRAGIELLGHELTHVVQQREGRVTNPYGQGIAIIQDPELEAEADAMGSKLAAEMWSLPSSPKLSFHKNLTLQLAIITPEGLKKDDYLFTKAAKDPPDGGEISDPPDDTDSEMVIYKLKPNQLSYRTSEDLIEALRRPVRNLESISPFYKNKERRLPIYNNGEERRPYLEYLGGKLGASRIIADRESSKVYLSYHYGDDSAIKNTVPLWAKPLGGAKISPFVELNEWHWPVNRIKEDARKWWIEEDRLRR